MHEHDEETGLLNLAGFLSRLDGVVRRSGGDRRLIVASVHLTTFLEIQNTFGPPFGVRVLAAVAARAQAVLPEHAIVAVIQPDRLAAVVDHDDVAPAMRERLEAATVESYVVGGLPIHVEVATGIAHFPTHARTAEELFRKASIAMRWAVTTKDLVSVYDPSNDRPSRDTLVLLGELPEAIRRGQLEVWHQGLHELLVDLQGRDPGD